MKGLKSFLYFDFERFLVGKRLVYLKATPWLEQGNDLGCKVTLQIVEDKTTYAHENIENYGEQLVVKVRNCSPAAFAKLRPLDTEVTITDVERATVYGDFGQSLSIIAKISVIGAKST